MDSIGFVKLIKISHQTELADGKIVTAYRYMDIDGNIIAEGIENDEDAYPSMIREYNNAVRQIEAAKDETDKLEIEAKTKAQAEWNAIRTKMAESIK